MALLVSGLQVLQPSENPRGNRTREDPPTRIARQNGYGAAKPRRTGTRNLAARLAAGNKKPAAVIVAGKCGSGRCAFSRETMPESTCKSNWAETYFAARDVGLIKLTRCGSDLFSGET